MSTKKIERALYGPSMTEVVLGATLSVILGAVLGAFSLIVKPSELVRELPEEPEQGAVYILEGSRDAARGRTGTAKRQAFLAGQGVTVTEEELNVALAAGGNEGEGSAGLVVPGTPNFRIADGRLQIAVPTTVSVAGFSKPVLVVGSGGFENRGGTIAFVPDEFHVGSLNASSLPFLKGFLTGQIMAAKPPSEELAAAWARVTGANLQDRSLTLVTQ
jgi:hypothetical protein